MARRRGRHHSRGMKIPIISLAILGGQIGSAYLGNSGNLAGTASTFASYYTGFSPLYGDFKPERLLVGYGPWLIKRFVLPIARPRLGGMKLPVSLS